MLFSLCACANNQKAEKYCSSCGEGLSNEDAFCEHCGAATGKAKIESEGNQSDSIVSNESVGDAVEETSKLSSTTSSDTSVSTPSSSTPSSSKPSSSTPSSDRPDLFSASDIIFIEENDFSYRLTYKYPKVDVEITKYSGCANTLNIPETVRGYAVTAICEEVFMDCTFLTSVTIPNSVTTIGALAFANCTSLTTVILPNSLTTIEKSVFFKCISLTSVLIPNGITAIGSSAFYSCVSLPSITIPNSVTSIGSGAFYYCTSLKTVYFQSQSHKEFFKIHFEESKPKFIVQ